MLDRFVSPQDSFEIERATHYLVTQYEESGNNPKPVVFHSLRVGYYLLELNYEIEIVIAAILHDLIEDTDVTRDDLEKEFGATVADMVAAVSFNPEIKDSVEKYEEMFERTIAAGRGAVVVKAADLHANSIYFHLAKGKEKRDELLEKTRFFLEQTPHHSDEPVIRALKKRHEEELVQIEQKAGQ